MRLLGYIPSGILFTLFCFLGVRCFPPATAVKIGFFGVGIFYGIGTIVVSISPFESGCNPAYINPSISQVIHNVSALVIYAFVPLCIVITGVGLKKF